MNLEKIPGIELAFYKKSKKEAVTTSRLLAKEFGKQHKDVLRQIDKVKKENKERVTGRTCSLSSYVDTSGKRNKEYVLDRDVAMFLVMNFKGKKADEHKWRFIDAFNEMEQWIAHRIQASLEHKVMADTILETRTLAGKETKTHQYSNEARLVNWAMTGKFGKLDREELSQAELDLLYDLQKRNAVLIGAGMEYADRKESLKLYVELNR